MKTVDLAEAWGYGLDLRSTNFAEIIGVNNKHSGRTENENDFSIIRARPFEVAGVYVKQEAIPSRWNAYCRG